MSSVGAVSSSVHFPDRVGLVVYLEEDISLAL